MSFDHAAHPEQPQFTEYPENSTASNASCAVARFAIGAEFRCNLEDVQTASPRVVSDLHETAPAPTKDAAERLVRLLGRCHRQLGTEARYAIQEETVLGGSGDRARLFLSVIRTGGTALPERLVRELAASFMQTCIGKKNTVLECIEAEVKVEVDIKDLAPPDLVEQARGTSVSELEKDALTLRKLDGAVREEAGEFAKAHGGRRTDIVIEFDHEDRVPGIGSVKKAPIKTRSERTYEATAKLDGVVVSGNEARLVVSSIHSIEPEPQKNEDPPDLGTILANIGTRDDVDDREILLGRVLELLGKRHFDVSVEIRESQSTTTGKPIFDLLAISPVGLFATGTPTPRTIEACSSTRNAERQPHHHEVDTVNERG
ncbi:MAG: hypothetical protein U1C47_18110 [Hydrogenophaga sp.]|uniref:hypothetical protein n=1 Tax=Hydrogenophaga sp. TaxID=1904254 RepID=UPI002734A7BE|nr:hypothetical protein [Hydrogenophaga sp.]MDP3626144.1 hypothetical protein [Hydrogenophaga sp.]MDZ4293826.1 hypothetical protein [Hydrogenophaga sp.]